MTAVKRMDDAAGNFGRVMRQLFLLLALLLPGMAFAACPSCENPPNDASFVIQTVPTTMVAGQQYSVTLRFINEGMNTWTAANGYRIFAVPAGSTTWSPNSVTVPNSVGTGGVGIFTFNVTAPSTPGVYNFQWQMRNGAIASFGEKSTNVAITVSANAVPAAAITAPTNGASVVTGSSVAISANASDTDGTIQRVEFWIDGALHSQDTTSPYATTWTAVTGAHAIVAKAVDNLNAVGSSSTVSVTASVPNSAPTVSLTAPTNGQAIAAGASVSMSATAADSDGTIARVEFWVDGVKFSHDTATPFTGTWPSTAGSHTVQAKAFDNGGATTSSGVATISVNALPTAALTAPTNGQVVAVGTNVTLSATASDVGGSVQRVEFWIDGALHSQDTTSPYSTTWVAISGNHSIVAKAVDNLNEVGSSAAVTVTGTTANVSPSVSLTAPTQGQVFAAASNIALAATASDTDGTVARVEFWVDGALLSQDTVSPYTGSVVGTPGSHTIQARAFDDDGASTNTAIVSVTVSPPATPPTNVTLTRRFYYDANQRLCKIIEPESGSTFLRYDAVGNLVWSATGITLPTSTTCATDLPTALASGRVVSRTYDARGRKTSVAYPDQNGDITWTYEKDGLPSVVTTANAGVSVINAYAYNKRRFLVGETTDQPGATWSIGYGFNANGHLATLQNASGEIISYNPNALGQPTQVSSAYGAYASGVSYYPNGAIAGFTYGNGVVHTLAQNLRQLPDRSRDVFGGSVILDDSYVFDQVGNVKGILDGAQNGHGDRTMTYDGLDRLTAVDSPMYGAQGARYAYDSIDNMVSVTAPGRNHTYWYDAANRLTNVRDATGATVDGLGYDPQGNLANKSGLQFNYDIGDRLLSVTYGGVPKESYRYDGFGRRVFAGAPAGNIVSQYSASGVLLTQEDARQGKRFNNIYLAGSLVAIRETTLATGVDAIKYQHTDALGSPVAITSAAGAILQRNEYEPFGARLNASTTGGLDYAGHVLDAETGMLYMQQRYYDPENARFLSVDPVPPSAKGSLFNRYAYANNNPSTFRDPDGRRANNPMENWQRRCDSYCVELDKSTTEPVKPMPLRCRDTSRFYCSWDGTTWHVTVVVSYAQAIAILRVANVDGWWRLPPAKREQMQWFATHLLFTAMGSDKAMKWVEEIFLDTYGPKVPKLLAPLSAALDLPANGPAQEFAETGGALVYGTSDRLKSQWAEILQLQFLGNAVNEQ